jgi:hypothetical protein
MKLFFTIGLILLSVAGKSQKRDTVTIDGSNVRTANLKPGINRYLVYSKNGRDSSRTKYQLWTRIIDTVTYKEKGAISITQVWEDNDTILHKVYSICDKNTFQTFFQQSWWKGFGTFSFDFANGTATVNELPLLDTDTSVQKKRMYSGFKAAQTGHFFNWHLDLETFSILPLKENTTYRINFYDPGLAPPQFQFYTVTASATLSGYNNQSIDCWLLTHENGTSKEVFWISKITNEVVKLEQQFNGKYRYKVKLPFSS